MSNTWEPTTTLPPPNTPVLICVGDENEMFVARYDSADENEAWCVLDGAVRIAFNKDAPHHWMHLPEPPQEPKDEKTPQG